LNLNISIGEKYLYKNKTGISKRKFNHIINEINKIEIPSFHLKYLDKKEYRKVEYQM